MIGLLIAIILFNFIAFKTNRRLSSNQIVHIWFFSISFETLFDVFVEFKFHAYWYFSKDIDWEGVLPHLFIVPAANIIFLNWYPQKSSRWKRLFFFSLFVVVILIYEKITLLPSPWGYFHYGWWRMWHAVILDPILLLILLGFYKWICKLEKKAASR